MRGLTHRWTLANPGMTGRTEDRPTPPWGGFEPLVARVLQSRGVDGPAAATAFCDARLTELHDPSLLGGVDRSAARLLEALDRREPVAIYGDYDVDGMCGSAILFHAARALVPDAPIRTYVPHRVEEGYGLHAAALEQLAAEGAKVVVSVDCGVTAVGPAASARRAGLDLIITDHHLAAHESGTLDAGASAPAALPDAFAVVHPRLPGASYPFGELCGAGVAFKLAWRMLTMSEGRSRLSPERREVLLDLLALAALGTIADVVPLVGENRIIARHGLRRLRSTSLTGLTALIEASGLSGEDIDAERVGFLLAPRLNACGRLEHAQAAVDMLTVADAATAAQTARRLTGLNEERKQTERVIADEATQSAIDAGMTSEDHRAIVLAGEGWHVGVVGIVCSRLIGRFHRPTLLLCRQDSLCQGSGRSIDGFDLHAALSDCAPLLERFGGHAMAAGLAVRAERFAEFAQRFTAIANERIAPSSLLPELKVDCEARLSDLTPVAVAQLAALGPFGRANPSPRVLLRGVRVARPAQPMGARGAHLSLFIEDGNAEVRTVAWGWGERGVRLPTGDRIDAVVEPKLSTWNGRTRVEPELRDVRLI